VCVCVCVCCVLCVCLSACLSSVVCERWRLVAHQPLPLHPAGSECLCHCAQRGVDACEVGYAPGDDDILCFIRRLGSESRPQHQLGVSEGVGIRGVPRVFAVVTELVTATEAPPPATSVHTHPSGFNTWSLREAPVFSSSSLTAASTRLSGRLQGGASATTSDAATRVASAASERHAASRGTAKSGSDDRSATGFNSRTLTGDAGHCVTRDLSNALKPGGGDSGWQSISAVAVAHSRSDNTWKRRPAGSHNWLLDQRVIHHPVKVMREFVVRESDFGGRYSPPRHVE